MKTTTTAAAAVMRRAHDIRTSAAVELASVIVADVPAAVAAYDIDPSVAEALFAAARAGDTSAAVRLARRLVDFGACLRAAWAESGNTSSARRASASVRAEWARLTPEAQRDFCAACVVRASRDIIGYSVEDHYASYWERPAFAAPFIEMGDYVDEAFARVLEYLNTPEKLESTNTRRALKGNAPRTLASIVYLCAKNAVQSVARAEAKHSRASEREVVDFDGNTVAAVDYCQPRGDSKGSVRRPTEEGVILSASVAAFADGRDDIDRAIIAGLQARRTYRAIGEAVNMSHVAVVKRVKKIRDDMRAAGF